MIPRIIMALALLPSLTSAVPTDRPAPARPPIGPAHTGLSGTAAPPRWHRPLSGRLQILRRFSPPPQPWLAGHRGVDLAAAPGAEVRSAGPGRVGHAGPVAGRGVVTVIHPGGLRTTYLPVRASVRPGQPVTPGEVLGSLENLPGRLSGHCPASCLHWGLLRDRDYLDPLLLIGLGQVRLLPIWTHAPS
ncbi:murein hydrolase activator EnvC family protein [Planobispora longispora]|uniref:murein hydrolase activator EnvC family protein n=1 Tax=Planobispora longispora TaxID=28887 RepID=UPI001EF52A0C|nr:M23 family metallopeptidase [Planobispora longispora]